MPRAAGDVAAIVTIQVIRTRWVHPNLNLYHPDNDVVYMTSYRFLVFINKSIQVDSYLKLLKYETLILNWLNLINEQYKKRVKPLKLVQSIFSYVDLFNPGPRYQGVRKIFL
ncbi:hypothetical protein Hanom_Chr11g01022481 [Helianthus anomalus]